MADPYGQDDLQVSVLHRIYHETALNKVLFIQHTQLECLQITLKKSHPSIRMQKRDLTGQC
jgi:hypothetical protein